MEDTKFSFEFSLEVLNHLGRGLYRSFATVIAEAVSNSWDAEATEVKILIDKDRLVVEDNGKGMSSLDFQEKFLKVGYSRRLDRENKSKRKVIGRKGIGKLAMLSISEKVTIFSKKLEENITGGSINNVNLDREIRKDGSYYLENLSLAEISKFDIQNSGTKIIFEGIKTKLNGEDVIRKYLATQFNFIFSLRPGDSFKIIVNGTEITQQDIRELDNSTQFIWFLGKVDQVRKDRYERLKEYKVIENTEFNFNGKTLLIKGFIASVEYPKNLLLRGSEGDFKAGINLFCNGRLRQENLFEEIASKRLAEEYLYGEVHLDDLDDESIDRFTSSREGIIKDDPLYQRFLSELRKIQTVILANWTPWRREHRYEADIEDVSIPKYQARIEDSRNWREKDFERKIEENIDNESVKKDLKEKLKNLSIKNTVIYQDLFILENIFREYIKLKKIDESSFDITVREEKDIIDWMKNIRSLRKADEERHVLKGKIVKEEHYLNYFDLYYLSEIVDLLIHKVNKTQKKYRRELTADAKEINPVRNPVMHTNEVADDVFSWDKIKNVTDYIDGLKG